MRPGFRLEADAIRSVSGATPCDARRGAGRRDNLRGSPESCRANRCTGIEHRLGDAPARGERRPRLRRLEAKPPASSRCALLASGRQASCDPRADRRQPHEHFSRRRQALGPRAARNLTQSFRPPSAGRRLTVRQRAKKFSVSDRPAASWLAAAAKRAPPVQHHTQPIRPLPRHDCALAVALCISEVPQRRPQ